MLIEQNSGLYIQVYTKTYSAHGDNHFFTVYIELSWLPTGFWITDCAPHPPPHPTPIALPHPPAPSPPFTLTLKRTTMMLQGVNCQTTHLQSKPEKDWKECRSEVSQNEHSAVLLTCIKIPNGFQAFVLTILSGRFETGFTVHINVISVYCTQTFLTMYHACTMIWKKSFYVSEEQWCWSDCAGLFHLFYQLYMFREQNLGPMYFIDILWSKGHNHFSKYNSWKDFFF